MDIKNLPGPGMGLKFRTKAGTGVRNFERELRRATKYGDLQNLRDNQKEIVDTVKKYEKAIKFKGGLNRLQKRDAWRKIKAGDAPVTKEDKREIKQILNHLGRDAAKEKKSVEAETSIKASDGEGFLTKRQVERNLQTRARLENRGVIGRQSFRTSYAGHREVESYGIRGTAEEIGIKKFKTGFAAERSGAGKAKVGFAAGLKDNKSPNNPAPQAPLKGSRPIDL